MSKPARYLVIAVAVLTVALEIAAYLTYRDTVDGQSALVNVAIFVYALFAVGIVRAVDAVVRRLRRPADSANPS